MWPVSSVWKVMTLHTFAHLENSSICSYRYRHLGIIKHKLTLVRGWDVKKKMMNNGVSSKQVIKQYFSNKKHQNLTFYFKDLGNDATLWAYPQKQPSELLSFPQNWQHQSQLQPLTSSRWFLCFLYLGGRIWRIRQDKPELVFLHVRAKSNFY